MPARSRLPRAALLVLLSLLSPAARPAGAQVPPGPSTPPPSRAQVLAAMQRATACMVDTVSCQGGYVWSYLPDRSRRWGELEAYDTMIWIQPPGTATMGHAFLDAYHATREPQFYEAALKAARALVAAQHPSGGWHYFHDFAGPASRERWYRTIGRNAWRLEEFQHDWGNATFDDGGTSEAITLLLRMGLERRQPDLEAALDRAVAFVLDSQYPNGAWPQRYPKAAPFEKAGHPDYTAYYTINDDVAAGNIEVLLRVYQVRGGNRLRDAIRRGMQAFVTTQLPAPQAGWALQYTHDGTPAAARSYEPAGLATHATASNVEQLLQFYRLTGDSSFLARVPEALAWLEAVALPPSLAGPGRTHPTFVEVGTNRPIYVHRRGSNVVNGAYYADGDPEHTIGHYSSFRFVPTADLRRRYEALRRMPAAEATRGSVLLAAPGTVPLDPYVTVREPRSMPGFTPPPLADRVARIVSSARADGCWLSELGSTSHPYTADGSPAPVPGDFGRTTVGDDTDTSPFRGPRVAGISTATFVRNMADLVRYLDQVK